jgi:spermidine/putrescine transport system permease protein
MNQARKLDGLNLYALAYLVFLYGPVLLLPLFSFNNSIYVAFPFRGLTFDWYKQMAENADLIAALRASIEVGVAVAFISTVLGLLAAKAVTRYPIPGRATIIGFIMLPLVVPSLILALALLVVIRKLLDLDLSLITVTAGHVMLCVPYAMLIMISRLEGFDRSLEEAGSDLGDNPWQTFWRITLPLAWPGIVSSLLLCFSASFDEYLVAAFLCGSQVTLPVFIFSQLRFPQLLPNVLALGSCILVGSVVLVVFSEWIRRRGLPAATSTPGMMPS